MYVYVCPCLMRASPSLQPNYDPFRLVALATFERELCRSGKANPADKLSIQTRACLVGLRELFLEMTPIHQCPYNGQDYNPFRYRHVDVPLSLDKFGPSPRSGEVPMFLQRIVASRLKELERQAAVEVR